MEKEIRGPHGVTAAQHREQMHSGPAEGPHPLEEALPAPEETQLSGLPSYVFGVCTTPDRCNVKAALCVGGSGGWLWLLVITD